VTRAPRQVGWLLLALIACVGCSKSKGTVETYPPATTPRQLLLNEYTAQLEGDRDAFLNCYDTHRAGRSILGASFDRDQADKAYRETFVETFHPGGMGAPTPEPFDVSDDQIQIEGDTAWYVESETDTPRMMVRTDGVWAFDATDLPIVLEGEWLMRKRMQEKETDVLLAMIEKMKKPGATASGITRELQRRREEIFDEVAQEMLPTSVFDDDLRNPGR
jgi:hypothetical protein